MKHKKYFEYIFNLVQNNIKKMTTSSSSVCRPGKDNYFYSEVLIELTTGEVEKFKLFSSYAWAPTTESTETIIDKKEYFNHIWCCDSFNDIMIYVIKKNLEARNLFTHLNGILNTINSKASEIERLKTEIKQTENHLKNNFKNWGKINKFNSTLKKTPYKRKVLKFTYLNNSVLDKEFTHYSVLQSNLKDYDFNGNILHVIENVFFDKHQLKIREPGYYQSLSRIERFQEIQFKLSPRPSPNRIAKITNSFPLGFQYKQLDDEAWGLICEHYKINIKWMNTGKGRIFLQQKK